MQRPDVTLWEAEKEKIFTLYHLGREFGDDGEAERITRRRKQLIARHFPSNVRYRTAEYATITAERPRQQTQLFRDLDTAKQNQHATTRMPYMVRLVYYVYYDLERKNLIEQHQRKLIRDDCRAWRRSDSERRRQLDRQKRPRTQLESPSTVTQRNEQRQTVGRTMTKQQKCCKEPEKLSTLDTTMRDDILLNTP